MATRTQLQTTKHQTSAEHREPASSRSPPRPLPTPTSLRLGWSYQFCPSHAAATHAKQTGMMLVGALPPLLPVSCLSSAENKANDQPAPNAKLQVPRRETQTIDAPPTTNSKRQTDHYNAWRAFMLRTAAGLRTCQPTHSSPSFLSRSP